MADPAEMSCEESWALYYSRRSRWRKGTIKAAAAKNARPLVARQMTLYEFFGTSRAQPKKYLYQSRITEYFSSSPKPPATTGTLPLPGPLDGDDAILPVKDEQATTG